MSNEVLPSLDAATLTPVVRRIVGDAAATVVDWRVASLGYRVINGITGGLWRVAGEARAHGRAIGWSAVLKVLRRAGEGSAANFAPTEEPGHWNYWRREALVYDSPLLDTLAPGLVAPACYGVEEPEPGQRWLWLEDVAGMTARGWSDARWGLAARHLGRWQGAFAAGRRSLPDASWLCRGHLLAWVPAEATVPLDRLRQPSAWAHPLLRDHLPPDTGERVARLWARRDALLATAGRAPGTLCHLDLWGRNLLSRHIPSSKGDEADQTVLLDWSMLGYGVLGEDVANLVLDSVWMFDAAATRLPTFERAILAGYLDGLREAGWTGDPALVRASYAAIGALRFGLLAEPVLRLAHDETQHGIMEARYDLPIAAIVAQRAALLGHALALAES